MHPCDAPSDPAGELRYLDFDYSDADDGAGTFDAMASTGPDRLPQVHAEIARVLGWAHAAFPDGRGPVEDGADWDYDLQAVHETSRAELLEYDPETGRLAARPGAPGAPRHTVTLSIAGTPAFCAALRERFGID